MLWRALLMSGHPVVVESQARSSPSAEAVWDRVWRYRPSDERDDALLEREEASPRWQLVVDRLERTFGSIDGLQTIELGSGRGDLSVLLARRGARVTLLDRSERALEEASKRFDRLGLPAQFEQSDLLTRSDSRAGRFDVSLSIGVIEHFAGAQRSSVLEAHYDVLKSSGMTIVSVPHAWCPPYRLWKSYLELRRWWPYGMEIPYARHELSQRARKAGFQGVETHGLGFWQSVGNLWCKPLVGRWPDWSGARSRLDNVMGLMLVMFGQRDEHARDGIEVR